MRRTAATFLLLCAGCSSAQDGGSDVGFGAPPATGGDGSALADAGGSAFASSPSGEGGPLFGPVDGGAPAVSGSCQPGSYVGTYNGVNDSSKLGGPTNFPVSGPLGITLVASTQQSGEFQLVVTTGATFQAVWGGFSLGDGAAGLVVVNAPLTGQLDCGTGAFDAVSQNASWTLIGIPMGDATVEFKGSYDPAAATISGTFSMTSLVTPSGALDTGSGTFSITLSPASDP